jgi:ribosomal-protein-alanine N-acetyltransferase
VTQPLQTARLDLEPVRSSHADEAWPQLDDDRLWTYFPSLRPRGIENLRRLYERWERGSPDGHDVWLNWICRLRTTKKLAGAMQATIRGHRIAYIAYAFYPANQRKGYAREAAQAVIAHLREAYGITRFRAEMDTRNEPSYRLAESLGFTRIETHEAPDLGQGPAKEYLYELS